MLPDQLAQGWAINSLINVHKKYVDMNDTCMSCVFDIIYFSSNATMFMHLHCIACVITLVDDVHHYSI